MSLLNKSILKFAKEKLGKRVYAIVNPVRVPPKLCMGYFSGKDKGDSTKHSRSKCGIGLGQCWDLPYEAIRVAKGKTPNDIGKDAYVWSTKRISFENAIPGDIIQFFKVRVDLKITKPDGRWKTRSLSYSTVHSAIFVEKKENGTIGVYEQHVGGNGKVQLNHNYIIPGSYKLLNGTKIDVTRKGNVIFYRPEKKERAFLIGIKKRKQLAQYTNTGIFYSRKKKVIL